MRFLKKKPLKLNRLRIIKRFAFLPVEAGDYIVWLEYYLVVQRAERFSWRHEVAWQDKDYSIINDYLTLKLKWNEY